MKGKNMDEFSQIMQDVLNEIKSTLDTAPSSFKLWFGDLKLVALDDTSATFRTSSESAGSDERPNAALSRTGHWTLPV